MRQRASNESVSCFFRDLQPLLSYAKVTVWEGFFDAGSRRLLRMILDIILDIIHGRVIISNETGLPERAPTRSCANPLEHSQFYCEEKQ